MSIKKLFDGCQKMLQSINSVPENVVVTAVPTFDDLIADVRQWGDDRLITKNSTPQAQLLKCMSELGELADGTLKKNKREMMDGLGDVFVTLIMYAETAELCPWECLTLAYNEIKDRKGHLTPEGVFVKEE
jgi:hypothetical protein